MKLHRWWDATFAIEVLLLATSAPMLFFPTRFPTWAMAMGMGLLATGWIWRRWRVGSFLARTPVDWPVFFLFGIMLPVAVMVSPHILRAQYSIPNALTLIWSFCLFWVVVIYVSRSRQLAVLCILGYFGMGLLVASLAPLGTQWILKLPGLGSALTQIPTPLIGLFQGAESGFHPNQVAGTLLYSVLFALPPLYYLLRHRPSHPLTWIFFLCTAWIGTVFFLMQSRSAWVAFAVGLLCMILVNWRWGRWTLAAGALLIIVAVPLIPFGRLLDISELLTSDLGQGVLSLKGRPEIWQRAIMAISDFSFTGMGLGTFRAIVHTFYPFFNISTSFDVAHAHNYFLQSALDVGLPGLIAIVSIFLVAMGQLVALLRAATGEVYAWTLGLFGVLVAQIVFGLTDAVALGAKTDFMLWFLFALIFGLANRLIREGGEQTAEGETLTAS